MEWSGIISGAIGGGSIVGATLNAYYKNRLARADQRRAEELEAKKAVIDLLPELSKAENTYRIFLSDSLYLHDLDGNIQSGMIPTISSVAPSEGLVEKLKTSPLHLMGGQAASALSHHASELAILEQELASMQSTVNYEYDDPGRIAWNAKSTMEKRLSDFIIDLHLLRKQLTLEYVGKAGWPKNNKLRLSELYSLRQQAHNVATLRSRTASLRRWISISRVKMRGRRRKWWRELRARR